MDAPPDEADLLAREPAVLTGALIGYARVSTADQILDRQTRALAEVGCLRVFAEKRTGRTAERPELQACLDYLRPGDTLVVVSLDRLSRSLADLITLVADLRRHASASAACTRRWTPPRPVAGSSSTSSPPWPSSSANSSSKALAKASTPHAPAVPASAGHLP